MEVQPDIPLHCELIIKEEELLGMPVKLEGEGCISDPSMEFDNEDQTVIKVEGQATSEIGADFIPSENEMLSRLQKKKKTIKKRKIVLKNDPDFDQPSKKRVKGERSKKEKDSGQSPLKCQECDKTFTRPQHLNSHKLIHTGEKPFNCQKCGKKFRRKDKLKIHERIHTGERPYSCLYCDFKGNTSDNLKTHLKRMHFKEEKSYSCSKCDAKFSERPLLKAHIKHICNKPFCCSQCKKRFTTPDGLNKHEKKHNGQRVVSCVICNEIFTRLDHLRTHSLIHTGEKPFSCFHCDYRCIQSSNLKKHLKAIHKDDKQYSFSKYDLKSKKNDQIRNQGTGHKNYTAQNLLRKPEGVLINGGMLHCSYCNTSCTSQGSLELHELNCRHKSNSNDKAFSNSE